MGVRYKSWFFKQIFLANSTLYISHNVTGFNCWVNILSISYERAQMATSSHKEWKPNIQLISISAPVLIVKH